MDARKDISLDLATIDCGHLPLIWAPIATVNEDSTRLSHWSALTAPSCHCWCCFCAAGILQQQKQQQQRQVNYFRKRSNYTTATWFLQQKHISNSIMFTDSNIIINSNKIGLAATETVEPTETSVSVTFIRPAWVFSWPSVNKPAQVRRRTFLKPSTFFMDNSNVR